MKASVQYARRGLVAQSDPWPGGRGTGGIPDPQSLLTEQQAAIYLGLSPRTLQNWRVRGIGPAFMKIGRLVRYRRQDVADWAGAQLRQSTSEPV